jgi:hypothetical protein
MHSSHVEGYGDHDRAVVLKGFQISGTTNIDHHTVAAQHVGKSLGDLLSRARTSGVGYEHTLLHGYLLSAVLEFNGLQ